MVSAINTALVSGMLLLGSSVGALPQETTTKTLYFENDICLSVDLTAPEITDVQTARRFSLDAIRGFFLEATTFRLNLPTATETVSLRVSSAYVRPLESTARNFGQCAFTAGPEGFVQQIDENGVCTVVGDVEVFHSDPGSTDNLIVRCRAALPGGCQSMTLQEPVGPLQVGLSATIREADPASWQPLANDLRQFLKDHITYLPQC